MWAGSSAGRAPQWHCGGQGFDPPPVQQYSEELRVKNEELKAKTRESRNEKRSDN